jgi:hypothetical protein
VAGAWSAARPLIVMWIRLLTRATDCLLGRRPHRSIRTGPWLRWLELLRMSPEYYRTLWELRPRERPARLAQIHLEATNHCNLRCITCTNPVQTAPRGFMPLERARAVIDQALDASGPDTIIGFYIRGESTLHPGLAEMIAYARDRGFRRLLLSTNASRLDPARAEAILAAGLSELRLSVDGADAAAFERIRVGASFRRVRDTIETLDRTRRRLGSRALFRLHATLDRSGLEDVPRFVRTWAGPIDRFKFTVAVNQGGLLDDAHAAAISGGLAFAVSGRFQLPCRPLFDYAGVTWDGKITSCCVDYHERFVAGRLEEGIAATFHGPASGALRAAHVRGDFGPTCSRCGFASALVDWFEDELDLYVEQNASRLADPALDCEYHRWLARAIRKFDRLAAGE